MKKPAKSTTTLHTFVIWAIAGVSAMIAYEYIPRFIYFCCWITLMLHFAVDIWDSRR